MISAGPPEWLLWKNLPLENINLYVFSILPCGLFLFIFQAGLPQLPDGTTLGLSAID